MTSRLFRPAGRYFPVTVPVPGDFSTAEDALVGRINGTDGGTWSPTNRIGIAGAGIALNAPPTLAVTRQRVIRLSALEYARGWDAALAHQFVVNYGAGSLDAWADNSALWLPLARVHNGAVLSAVRVFFQVPVGKVGLPSIPADYPYLGVFRHDPQFKDAESLLAAGFSQLPVASSLADYINGGAPKTLTLTPDQNNTIDRSSYEYFLLFVDDAVAGAPRNSILGIELVFDSITTLRMP